LDAIVQTAPLLSTICEVVVGTIAPSGEICADAFVEKIRRVTVHTKRLSIRDWVRMDLLVCMANVIKTGRRRETAKTNGH
jgi:hypothetical protein